MSVMVIMCKHDLKERNIQKITMLPFINLLLGFFFHTELIEADYYHYLIKIGIKMNYRKKWIDL